MLSSVYLPVLRLEITACLQVRTEKEFCVYFHLEKRGLASLLYHKKKLLCHKSMQIFSALSIGGKSSASHLPSCAPGVSIMTTRQRTCLSTFIGIVEELSTWTS